MITYERLVECLTYDQGSGDFIWRIKLSSRRPVGSIAGTIMADGRRHIMVDGHHYLAHRLAWFYTYRCWPGILDHANRDNSDNRISNLREATPSQNAANCKMHRTNTTGCPGVTYDKKRKKYCAAVKLNGRSINLGRYPTLLLASEAAARGRLELFGQFAPRFVTLS